MTRAELVLFAVGALEGWALWASERAQTKRLDALSERVAILEGVSTARFPYDIGCPTCDAPPGHRCRGTPAVAHGARYEVERTGPTP